MGYFIFGSNDRKTEIQSLETILSSLYTLSQKSIVMDADHFSLYSYCQDKAIEDVVIKHHRSESWMAVMGLPLISELKVGNPQQLMEAFLEDRKKVLRDRLDGHFLLVAYDAIARELVIASDFNCFIPVFYSMTSQGAVFCSSELALAKLIQPDVNELGIAQAINLGVTWKDITRFCNISKIQACEMITIDVQHHIRKEPYWQPSDETLWRDSFDDIIERWMALLQAGVREFYMAATNKTVTTNLTGGEDARLLVAACQALKIPYEAIVSGFSTDLDVAIAREAAQQADIPLKVNLLNRIGEAELLENAMDICLQRDGYGSFFRTNLTGERQKDANRFAYLHFSGVPGGEAFRGTYYNRAKLIFSSRSNHFDYRSFTKLKYLLDHYAGLLNFSDDDLLTSVYDSVKQSLKEVDGFPDGIRVDHLLREFQTCLWGLPKRGPFYLPLGLTSLTRSIYRIPPHFKRGGRLTKACTELLFEKLAHVKTQNGVPTIRKTWLRSPMFFPEYLAEAKKISNGVMRRYLHIRQSSKSLSKPHNLNYHSQAMITLLNHKPYADWFADTNTMITGRSYNQKLLDIMLSDARNGKCRYVQVLGRVINHELACRYVYNS